MRKLTWFLVTYLLALSVYFIAFPNDFFLPKRPFISNKDRFCYKQSFSRFTLFDKTLTSPKLLEIIDNPDQYLLEPKHIIKDNEKRTIAKLTIDSTSIILKRYNYSGIYDWITKCPFRTSKAYRAWYYQHELKKNGIETAKPIAIIEKRWGPLWRQTYLISEYIEGKTLDEKLLQSGEIIQKKVSKQIVEILNVFYKLKWLHRDLVGRNIIIKGETLAIIDLDEMHSYAFNNRIFKSKFHKKHYSKLIEKSRVPQDFIETFLMTHNQLYGYTSSEKEFEEL